MLEPELLHHKQPNPTPNDRTPIVDQVITDLMHRKQVGIERYGTPLQAFNGRRSLVDLYEELQDATVYIKQEIEEREEICGFLEAIANDSDVPESYRRKARAIVAGLA